MTLECKSSYAGNSDMLQSGHKMLPLSEQVKVLELIRKEKNCMLSLLRCTVRMNLQSMKKEKEIFASFGVTPRAVKVMATVCDKCLVKMERYYICGWKK